ncbi:M24 family metallopeptidase [Chlamydiifrater phoenicopteri]|uniref:M24 family metallopeptidase n=1 Tax=Chlamydiifrater phoenicopteri TaxID=2681469 RepID=UPI001BCEF5CE|nr:Xaa-Pro peptidase family protein [Chlamydiifrater phoenicopteri]
MGDNVRIQAARRLLEQLGVDAVLIDKQVDLEYLTYDNVSSGKLLISQGSATLYVALIDKDMYPSVPGVEVVVCAPKYMRAFADKIRGKYARLGFDGAETSYRSFHDLSSLDCELVPLSFFSEQLRAVKDREEIEVMREAASLGSRGWDYVLSLLREGVSEKDLAHALHIFWVKEKAEGFSFDPIIAFGANAALPHAKPSDRKLAKGDIIIVDIGVKWRGYCSDMTRTVAFGEPLEELSVAYSAVAEAQEAGISACREGALCGDVHNEVVSILESRGLKEFFIHGTGHGVGREVHEYPYLSVANATSFVPLQPGMIVTVEPGLYFPGKGGIRLEDSILITKDGAVSITNRAVSKEIPILN